jgi:hypothetical protein
MVKIGRLYSEGNILKNAAHQPVAELNPNITSEELVAYTNVFVSAIDMLEMLKHVAEDVLADFDQQYNSAMEFNNRPNVPSLGPAPMNMPELPEWLKELLLLIARAEGRECAPWIRSNSSSELA